MWRWRPRTTGALGRLQERVAVLLDGAGGAFPRHRLANPVGELLRLIARGPFVTSMTMGISSARASEDDDAAT